MLYHVRRQNPSVEINFNQDVFNQALIDLENKCVAMVGKTLSQLGLPAPTRGEERVLEADYIREMNYNKETLDEYVAAKEPLLNEDQKISLGMIMDRVTTQQGGIIFLDASGGTGKTFLTNLVLAKVRAQGDIALAIASSGIAATLMDGGRTAHSALKLPLDIARQENPICNISKTSGRAQVLKMCKLIIWDECTMAHKKALEALDATLKDIRGNNNLMGGALLLLCGDFRQTLPVIPKSTPADEIYACLKYSSVWKFVVKTTLKQNMRVHLGDENAEAFANKLLAIGEGRILLCSLSRVYVDHQVDPPASSLDGRSASALNRAGHRATPSSHCQSPASGRPNTVSTYPLKSSVRRLPFGHLHLDRFGPEEADRHKNLLVGCESIKPVDQRPAFSGLIPRDETTTPRGSETTAFSRWLSVPI
nr:uncharacterized protein LOC115263654 [Aedes albopictus]